MELINQTLRDLVGQIRSALQQLQSEPFIESLPSVLIKDDEVFRKLPEDVSAVYFLTHPIEELLYIGKANDLQRRWRPNGHVHDCLEPAIRLRQVKLAWWTLDRNILSVVEEVLIESWAPIWNGGVTGWIRMYRPDLEWPDDISEYLIASSENERGRTGRRMEQVNKIMRQRILDWR